MKLRVWAPRADSVDLVIGSDRHVMQAEAEGWWTVEAPEDSAGFAYGFSLDGGPPRPDPRGRRLPNGVHGPSTWEPVPDSATTFRAPPLASAILYELHVGTFSDAGTFDGAIQRLDHLTELGVTHVQLMPVASFPGRHGWGYDGVGLFSVHEAYGGPVGLRRFVDACHDRGLAVLVDVVYNHLGPEGNYLAEFGPYFTDRFHTPWGSAVNLDGPGSDEVRGFFIDNALSWLRDYGADGLRLDAVHALMDQSATHFLEELGQATEALQAQLGRPLVLIAESDLNDPRVVRSREAGGYGMHAQWTDDFHHALHALLTGERQGYYQDFGTLEALARSLRSAFVMDGRFAAFRRRRHGRPIQELPGDRFVVYTQTHDQVGNRAIGDRLGHIVGPRRLRIAAAVALLSPYVPMLFMGEEWGATTPFPFFSDFEDPQLRRAVREGRRREFREFGWAADDIPDPQADATFQSAKLRWDEKDQGEHLDLLQWYRRLIELRQSMPELRGGPRATMEVDFEEGSWLRFRRGRVTVAFSVAEAPTRVPCPGGEIRLAHALGIGWEKGGLMLPSDSVAVVVHPAD